MNSALRRLATILLLLAVPLRVYAAVAMMFCGPVDVAVHPAMVMTHESPTGTMDDSEPMVHDDGHAHHDGAASDHQSCSTCCCTGMIATARYDWQPQTFATPTTPDFAAIAVPPPVPHRLDRPPRDSLA